MNHYVPVMTPKVTLEASVMRRIVMWYAANLTALMDQDFRMF